MKFKKGNKRYVIVIRTWIAIKFPRIRLSAAVRTFWYSIKTGKPLIHFRGYNYKQLGSIQNFLLAGIAENWTEFLYWRKFKFEWFTPTYFSLLGLVNIQKAGRQICPKDNCEKFWNQIFEEVGNQLHEADAHAFAAPENFVRIGDDIRLVDYGNFKNKSFFSENQQLLKDFEFTSSQ